MTGGFLARPWLIAGVVLLLAIHPAGVGAQQSAADMAAAAPSQPLVRVAVLDNPPYAWVGPQGFMGLSIAAFKKISEQNHWQLDLKLYETHDAVLSALIHHQADVGIGGITVTSERALIVDFCDAYDIVPLTLMVKEEGRGVKVLRFFEVFLSLDVVVLFVVAFLIVMACGGLLRLIERAHGNDLFPAEFRHNAWWAVQAFFQNSGERFPSSERGRYLALLLMLAGTILTAQITAILTNNLAASVRADAPLTGIADVGTRRVATVADSYAEQWLQEVPVPTKAYKTPEQCAFAVEKGEVSGAVFDEFAFRRLLATNSATDLKIVGGTFGTHPHAYAVAKGSPYRVSINQGISWLMESGEWGRLYQQWVSGARSNAIAASEDAKEFGSLYLPRRGAPQCRLAALPYAGSRNMVGLEIPYLEIASYAF